MRAAIRVSIRRQVAVMALVGVVACRDEPPPPEVGAPSSGERGLVVSADDFQAGLPRDIPMAPNPLAEDANAQARGRELFVWFNCAGCHGMEGGGGIGPPLLDAQWIYGGEPANIFQSIAQGRPNGMPAYGGKIPDSEIWKLELYVRSLGASASQTGRAPTNPQQQRPGS